MLIKRLQLRNFTVHRELDIEFRSGINGIVGANGCGKSSVLDALCFAITGVTRGDGNKSENVTWGETQGRVVVEFEHGDSTYTIRRDFGKQTRQVLVHPGGEIDKTAEIARFVEALLGCPTDSLLNNVFVPQGKIESILFSTNTQRLKEIQQTVGLQRAADAERALGTEIGRYNVTVGLKEQLEAAQASMEQARSDCKELTDKLQELDTELAELRPAEDILRRAIDGQRTNAAIRQATERKTEAADELVEAMDAQKALKQDQETVDQMVERLGALASDAKERLHQDAVVRTNAERYAEMQATRDKLHEALKETGEAPDPDEVAELEDRVTRITSGLQVRRSQREGFSQRPPLPGEEDALKAKSEAKADLDAHAATMPDGPLDDVRRMREEADRLRGQLDVFATGECPTCRQPVEHFDAPSIEQEIADLLAKADETQSAFEKEWHERNAELIATLEAATSKAENFEKAAQIALGKAIEKLEADELATQSRLKTLRELTESRTGIEQRLEMIESQLTKEGADQTLDDAEAEALQKAVDDHQKASLRKSEIASELARYDQIVERAGASAKKAEAALAELGELEAIPSEEEVAKAKQDAEILSARTESRRAAAEELAMVEVRADQYQQTCERLEKQRAEEADEAAWVALLKRVRETLHVSGLPSMLMREYGHVLNRRMAYYLRLWESSFLLKLTEDLDFIVDFDDGKMLRAARVSGGQKIVSATSYRFSMADTFARQVGLLVLDEPTIYLDQDNIVHLQNLLLKLKELAGATGKQILLVTHEESLRNFLDHSIEIEPTTQNEE